MRLKKWKKYFKRWKTKNIIIGIIVCLSVFTVSGVVYYQVTTDRQAIEDNGYYECTGKFDKEKTPVANMLLFLKIINGSNFCDDDWFKEVQELQGILNAQIQKNVNSQDPYVKKMMELQQNIEKKLRAFSTKAWVSTLSTKDIDDLQKAYDAYHDYYYENYGKQEAV